MTIEEAKTFLDNLTVCIEEHPIVAGWLVEIADRKTEPQTETKTETKNSNLTFEKRTMRDCYNCKRYETEGECIECHYEPKDEPQTCKTCKWGERYRKGYDITMMDDECGGCCSWNSKWKPKDEPQTCDTCRFELYCPEMCEGCCEWDSHYEPKDEPQTERSEE